MSMELLTIMRRLRLEADSEIIPRAQAATFQALSRKETMIDHEGETVGVICSRLELDLSRGLTCFLVTIRGVSAPPSEKLCQLICRGIYDEEWKEPIVSPPPYRTFIRARVEHPAEAFAV